MWRPCVRRGEWRPIGLSEEEARRRVLDLVLRRHPEPLSYLALATEVSADPGDVADALTLAQAIRDLALAGLLCSDGVRVAPTRAALAFARLKAGIECPLLDGISWAAGTVVTTPGAFAFPGPEDVIEHAGHQDASDR